MIETPKLELPPIYSPEPIAIVGLGAVMPDAHTVDEFWQNIVTGHDSIQEVPLNRWDPDLYWDEDRDAPDKTYSKIGAFVKDFKLNPIEYRIPPNVLTQIDMVQQWALASAKQALEDANYTSENFPSERTAVIVGNSLGGEKSFEVSQRVYFPAIVRALKETENFQKLSEEEKEELITELEAEYKQTIPVINEDSMPGELANIVAGRIAATFNLRGKNMTSDAACASSLAAIDVAFKGLQAREFDAAVVGGSDRSMDPPTYVKFAKIGALSADGSFPFDERANGFVMGEGAGMMVVKRLSDAKRDGDKIYALITGVGSSSDGKGKGITAPNPIGQELAVKRALKAADVSAKDLQLIEAHGTSTSVGDYVEISTIEKVFKEQGAQPQTVRIGSIKSQIGHLKSAAGAAGLLKTALSIHHKLYPPSINFETPNSKIDWDQSPFMVNTHPIEWPKPQNDVRRAGVSSFGFGGTNFHVIMEEYDPDKDYSTTEEIYASRSVPEGLGYNDYLDRNRDLALEPILVSGTEFDDLIARIEELPRRLTAESYFDNEQEKTPLELVNNLHFSVDDPLRVGISAEDFTKLDPLVKITIGALADESKREIARNRGVFVSEGMPSGKIAFVFPGQGSQYADMMADLSQKYRIVKETFDEADSILSEFLDQSLSDYIFANGRERSEVEEGLRQTEITQPAMLTADIALFRLLSEYGLTPDIVAGHSLGEYAALVASGVLRFADALKAVAIRGKAMSEVDADDKGTMAAISASLEDVETILDDVEEYAIAANKNSLTTTVISGSTTGIEEAVKKFKEKGINAIPLSVSAAFHTEIVEPAAEPLSDFLDDIPFNPPTIPITSNVTGEFFPDDPEDIRSLMKQQVGAAVEWTKQIQLMHEEGATIFFEVGPKRALSTFVTDILADENIISVVCNHPKKGGIRTFNDAIAASAALGIDILRPKPRSDIFHPDYQLPKRPVMTPSSEPVQQPPAQPEPHQQGPLDYQQYQSIVDQVGQFLESEAGKAKKFGFNFDDVVITGTGVGLPGKHKEVFDQSNVDRILRGENLIDKLPKDKLEDQLEKNIRRLIKKSSGEAEFYSPSSYDDVIRLAGQAGKFDLTEEFGVKEEMASTYDVATSMAIAAGLEALKDAGIPLVREYKQTSTGSFLPGDYVLPRELQDGTGIVFASAFPGFDSFADEITRFKEYKLRSQNREQLTELYGEISRRVSGEAREYLLKKLDRELQQLDKEVRDYTFNRKILLEVLSFGHAQFAQLINARGPNTQVNAACASTTQALGIASDWIRTGRAKRVIVISADNVTGDNLFEWLGSGFLASGAASIKDKVEEAALPFDRRRAGMIVGMGAAGFMVESKVEAQRRGVTPIVELLGTHYSNSAYHGTRLDTRHVSEELQDFMQSIQTVHGISTDEVAKSLMFMSHETYTPRRGGSAAAEIRSLRETFGHSASQIHIANTKGFTGHPMGAGIEDAIAIKSVEKGRIPPIANFKEPDPDLGNLKLSQGQKTQVEYALRLAAGFGSQISFALYKRVGSGNRFDGGYEGWLSSLGGTKDDLYLEGKTLRMKDTGAPGKIAKSRPQSRSRVKRSPPRSKPSPTPSIPSRSVEISEKSEVHTHEQATTPTSYTPVSDVDREEVISKVKDVIADLTGYSTDLLDPSLDIEADLGVDTVKMAESIGLLNDEFGLETQEGMNVADYNTINKVADYYVERIGEGEVSPSPGVVEQEPATISTEQGSKPAATGSFDQIVEIVSDLTGYPAVMMPDASINLILDLGVDADTKSQIDQQIASQLGGSASNFVDAQTLQDYLDIIGGGTATSTPVSPKKVQPKQEKKATSKPAVTQGSQDADVDDSIHQLVKGKIAEISGYPEMMIEDSLHLQNDLGIDLETLDQIINAISAERSVNVQELGKAVTVADLLKAVAGESLPEVVREEKPSSLIEEIEEEESREETVIPESDEEVLEEITNIIADKTGYPPEMLDPTLDLESELGIDTVKQAEIFGIAREKYGIPPIEGMQIAEYNTITKIADLIGSKSGSPQKMVKEQRKVEPKPDDTSKQPETFRYVIRENQEDKESDYDGELIVFADPEYLPEEFSDLFEAQPQSSLEKAELESSKDLLVINPTPDLVPDLSEFFMYLKYNIENLGHLILAVSPTSENSVSIHHLSPVQGAIGGMFKALAMEFSDVTAKIIVFEDISQIKTEISNDGVEVIFRDDQRYEIALTPQDLPVKDYTLPEDSVLLASGGAQGITYQLIKSIAAEGSTLILLGRTEIRDDADEIAQLSDSDKEQRKFKLMKQMQDEGKQVTPVMLEKEWSKITKSATVYKSLAELRSMGCEVIYESVDVTNATSVSAAFEHIRMQLNKRDITHFIHGAGIEISKATKSKKTEEFKFVYSVKTDGFENLLSELRLDKLQLVIGFSSVAGRFGNATQVDYSAANEYLAKRCAQLNREGIRSVVIDWSAWDEVGMATRGSTMQVLESQGVTPIPVDEGVNRFKSELAMGDEIEVIISGQLGALANKVNWFKPDFFRGVMMDDFDGESLSSSRTLSLENDLYLDDHRIEGKVVLPGVMGLETMAEVCRAIQDQSVRSIYDVEFKSPVKLPRDEDLEIITFAERMGNYLDLELKSKFIGPDGNQLGDLRSHFIARMITGEMIPGYPAVQKNKISEIRETVELSKDEIYDIYFHGSSYQVLEAMNVLYEDGVIASYHQPDNQMFEHEVELEIDPLLIEAAFQAAGLHLLFVKQEMGLPAGVDAIHLFQSNSKPAVIRAYFVSQTKTHSTYNVEVIDEDGTCIVLLRNYTMIHTGATETPEVELTSDPDQVFLRKMAGDLDENLVIVDTDPLEEVSEQFIENFLSIAEQTRFSGIQAKKKRTEWLGGRIAAKLSLGHFHKVNPRSIEIEKDDNRSPFAIINGEKTHVSISHSHGIAVGVAGETTVDLERIESRAPSFIREAFSEEQIEKYDLLNIDEKLITKLWTLKEAHLKRMRIGLKTSLHDVEIKDNGGDTAIVTSPQGQSYCEFTSSDNFVITVAKPEDEAKITSLF